MQKLKLPEARFRIKSHESKFQIFDEVRKKFVALTPEEWVRQHFVNFLITSQNFPAGLIAVEMLVKVNNLSQRADVVVYDKKGKPVIIVECKAPSVPITQTVFNQVARYNSKLNVDYLIVTNGMQHFCARLTDDKGNYELLKEIPSYSDINEEKA